MDFGKGYSKQLDNHYSIHIAENNDEILGLILDFNKQVHTEEHIQTYIRSIIQKYPRRKKIYWLYIRDNEKDKIISSLCLSPLKWQIENIEFPACEMEFVGTLMPYRQKGFIKILNTLYEQLMEQHGYVISVIRGIPYFYRTLGYEFVSSLDERIKLKTSQITTKKLNNITFNKANLTDIILIKSKYSDYHNRFHIFNKFDVDCFKFKYFNEKFNSEVRTTYIIKEDGYAVNYFSLGMSYDNQCYEIICPDLTVNQMIAVLQFIKEIGNFKDNDKMTLSISKQTSFYNYITSIGGELFSEYGWQVKIPNLERFLNCIKKIIEAQLEQSEFNNLSKSIRISNYREIIKLEIDKGKIKKIQRRTEIPDPEKTDLRIPNGFLYMLLLGDRSFEEINYLIKDALVDPLSKNLIETIFPKKASLFESYI